MLADGSEVEKESHMWRLRACRKCVCVWLAGGGWGGGRVFPFVHYMRARRLWGDTKVTNQQQRIKKQAVACNAEQRHKLLFWFHRGKVATPTKHNCTQSGERGEAKAGLESTAAHPSTYIKLPQAKPAERSTHNHIWDVIVNTPFTQLPCASSSSSYISYFTKYMVCDCELL